MFQLWINAQFQKILVPIIFNPLLYKEWIQIAASCKGTKNEVWGYLFHVRLKCFDFQSDETFQKQICSRIAISKILYKSCEILLFLYRKLHAFERIAADKMECGP
ncbi:hypothetical protein AVEN_145040-1 [Araneus ventricosus]|uniref:Uncharacterized protein n=1 Tax=Araneus ventricosus TaxID=182803 RepID=A0A4Y2ME65_ARAVE|nr:hypothetical protein AVEN_59846-1 [Araneus ventricosus]GBN25421.1 hypothetical protein AVEN_145040-1 [Araneus ventricosus]